jgi:hypothetical protein
LKATKPKVKSLWLARYSHQIDAYIIKHFGVAGGITSLFPYMKANFNWYGKTDPSDPRTALKSLNEYHGLERHARQYYLGALYREGGRALAHCSRLAQGNDAGANPLGSPACSRSRVRNQKLQI